MRTINTLKNSISTLLFQVLVLVVGLFLPKLIISTYGSEVNGLTSNMNQILNILNLLQAGIVGASIFELFKPISDNDNEKIAEIYYSTKKYLFRISIVFFFLSLFAIPYLAFRNDSSLKIVDIIYSVVILGSSGAFIFGFYCKYDVIFAAHQKRYILILSMAIEKLFYYSVVFIIIFYKLPYILMYLTVLAGNVIRVFALSIFFKKMYEPQLKEWCYKNNYKIKNQTKLFGNQVVQNLIEVAPTFIITAFYGLQYASVLSVYLLITNVFKMIFSTLQNSVSSSFGDLAVKHDSKKVCEVFNLIQFVFSFLAILFFMTLNNMFLPFVELYIGPGSDISYGRSILSFVMTFYISCSVLFLPMNMFINSLGLYGKVLRFNCVNGLASILVSIVLSFINFELVYVGTIFFYLCSIFHRYFIIRSYGASFFKNVCISVVFPLSLIIISTFMNGFIQRFADGLISWFLTSTIVFFFYFLLSSVFSIIFYGQELRLGKKYLFHLLKK